MLMGAGIIFLQIIFFYPRIKIFLNLRTVIPSDYTYRYLEGVHLTLPPHIFSVQVKSGACYITGEWGQVQNKIKET